MPLYTVKCNECGKVDDIFLRLSDYKNLPVCCNVIMSRVITPINIQANIQPYKSMVTGEMITSRSQHRKHLKEHKCVEVGNEPIKPKNTEFGIKGKEMEALKMDISQRLEAIR